MLFIDQSSEIRKKGAQQGIAATEVVIEFLGREGCEHCVEVCAVGGMPIDLACRRRSLVERPVPPSLKLFWNKKRIRVGYLLYLRPEARRIFPRPAAPYPVDEPCRLKAAQGRMHRGV